MESIKSVLQLVEESRSLERTGNLDAAIQRAWDAMWLAKAEKNAEGEASALVVFAGVSLRLGNYAEASTLCKNALELAGSDSPVRANALLQIGICSAETNDLDAAQEYFQQAIDLSRSIGSAYVLIRSLHGISCGIFMPRGQFDLSLEADEEALQIVEKNGYHEQAWASLTTMCWNYWLMGQRDQTKIMLESLREASVPGSIGEGYWYFIHANLALEAGDLETAQIWLSRLFYNAEMSGVVEVKYLHRLGMSRLERIRGDGSAARGWASEALMLVERTGYCHLQGMALVERAHSAWLTGNLAAAEADFRAAIDILEPLKLNFDLTRAELGLASLLHQQKNSQSGEVWRKAASLILQEGFDCLIGREHALIIPLISAYINDQNKLWSETTRAFLKRFQQSLKALAENHLPVGR